jgi:protein-S-isoprenylcysteine O-methyltransferase Ste14
MNELNRKAFGGLLKLLFCVSLLIFLPAWTLKYWQGWVFICVFFASALAITVYLMKNDPSLLERRVKAGAAAENEISQRIIQVLAAVAFAGTIVLPAFDHRFGWSVVRVYEALTGDGLVMLGFFIVFLVFKENSYTSGIIEVVAEQKVVLTGPYAVVRHPMYAGALILLCGVPMALGSWWGLFTLIPMTMVLVWRLLDEERFLTSNLSGYSEYRDRVRYRLAPFVW